MIYENYIRVLNIDMATQKARVDEREDLMPYLGGGGVAAKLLEENMHPELPPLDPAQPVVFAIGPLNHLFPVMTKTVAAFISPLTGEYGESHAGGRLGTMLFQAGFDAIVITGRAVHPMFLSIKPHGFIFRDARPMWDTDSDQSVGRVLRELEPGSGKHSIIRIGPAGENLVSFASVVVDHYRHFGRLGLGAVLGSKLLKAITVSGGRDIPIRDVKAYFTAYRAINEKCVSTDMMAKYHDVGTPINIAPLNAVGALPTLNLQQAHYDGADAVSGETFAQETLVRKIACTGCPVGCIHVGQFRRAFAEQGYEYETVSVGYDYELIFSLGTFLGIGSTTEILELIDTVEEAGLDAMSAGVVLGWATEALSKGLITQEQTLVPLAFGNKAAYIEAIRHIAKPKNEFYRDLGRGSRYASKKYGGADFAMQVAGNEMAGYHTGYGALIGAAVGARHSHLCNAGYSIDQSAKEEMSPDALLDALEKEEIERCMLNSLVMCLFARKVYDRPTILMAFHAIGRDMTDQELSDIALRNYQTKLRVKKALGFKLEDIKLPKRFFETPSMHGKLDEETAKRMLADYQQRVAALIEGAETK